MVFPCRTGRGKKKDKQMQQALMMAGMMAAAVMGPMAIKMIALMAGKALLLAKIALVLSGITALKKLLQQQQGGGGGGDSESSHGHYGRSLRLDAAHDAAYSAQKQWSPSVATGIYLLFIYSNRLIAVRTDSNVNVVGLYNV